ncbi:MAG TPA: universal stress protein [Rubrivivax sp.]|nr:universal stress protein [Rubrivivax sp.]
MIPFKYILAATDFSAAADRAVQRAALLARQHGARLGLVHVVNPTRLNRVHGWLAAAIDRQPPQADPRERLRLLAAQLVRRCGITVEVELRSSSTVEALQRASSRADLLVVGQRRRPAWADLVLGGTAQRLVEACRKPLLVVKQPADAAYRHMLVPTDLSPVSDAAACVAVALSPESGLQLFHACDASGELVVRETEVSESVIRECRAREEAGLIARMRRNMARLGLDSRRIGFALGRGSPVAATLRQAQASGADLLVAAKLRRTRIGSTVLGSINSLVRRTDCDMLIVPARMREPRRAPVPRLPAPQAAGSGTGAARAAATARGPAWTRPPLPVAARSAAGHGAVRFAGE